MQLTGYTKRRYLQRVDVVEDEESWAGALRVIEIVHIRI